MHERPRALRILAALIALTAGYVDAIGFVGFGGIFVSFMSGNSTRLGASVTTTPGVAGWAFAVIASFVAGAAIGEACGGGVDRTRRVRVLAMVSVSLAVAAMVAARVEPLVAIMIAAFAMGAINTVFSASPLPVGLTYMTGTLVKLGEGLGRRLRGRATAPLGPYLLHWLALVAGAVIGAAACHRYGFAALWPAAGLTALLAVAAHRAPR